MGNTKIASGAAVIAIAGKEPSIVRALALIMPVSWHLLFHRIVVGEGAVDASDVLDIRFVILCLFWGNSVDGMIDDVADRAVGYWFWQVCAKTATRALRPINR